MSDDEPDLELLQLLRKSLGLDGGSRLDPPRITVLEDAKFVYDNSVDVALDMQGTRETAKSIYASMLGKGYDCKQWRQHELHPKAQDASTVEFIFTMDLLNFSFWSSHEPASERFAVEYRGSTWQGYWSLVASLQRAIEAGLPITQATFWIDEEKCSDDVLKNVFRSCTAEDMPMLSERISILREAGHVLNEVLPIATILRDCADEGSAL